MKFNDYMKYLVEEVTDEGVKRVKKDWENVAKEKIDVEKIGSAIYAFGSELAVLRIFHHYNVASGQQKVVGRVGNSKSKGWNFALEIKN